MRSYKQPNIISRAFTEAEKRGFLHLPPDEQIMWTPSSSFERKMTKLISREKKPYWNLINTTAKRVACCILAVIIMFGISMSVKAVRQPVIRFLTEVYEKYTKMIFPQQNETSIPQTIETVYTLPADKIPSGYRLVEEKNGLLSHSEKYSEENGTVISFSQRIASGSNAYLDTENADVINVSVGNYTGIYYCNKNIANLLWVTDEYFFDITAPDSFEINQLINLAENIQAKK